MSHLTDRISGGRASQEDVVLLQNVATQIRGKCLCALGEFSIEAVLSGLDRFRSDFDIAVLDQSAPVGIHSGPTAAEG
jgi:NADH-quinone oxidoreductase subunit F